MVIHIYQFSFRLGEISLGGKVGEPVTYGRCIPQESVPNATQHVRCEPTYKRTQPDKHDPEIQRGCGGPSPTNLKKREWRTPHKYSTAFGRKSMSCNYGRQTKPFGSFRFASPPNMRKGLLEHLFFYFQFSNFYDVIEYRRSILFLFHGRLDFSVSPLTSIPLGCRLGFATYWNRDRGWNFQAKRTRRRRRRTRKRSRR